MRRRVPSGGQHLPGHVVAVDSRRLTPCLVLLGLCSIALACGVRAPASSPHEPVAEVGELSVSREELDLYFAINLLTDDAEPQEPGDLDRVKSRLLDALVDEKTFLREAERRGLEVSELQIDAHLSADDDGGSAVPRLSESRRRQLVRQRLVVQKLQDDIANRLPSPSEEEVRAYIDRSRGRLAPRERVRLRALRFESGDDAVLAAARLRDGRTSFADAAVTYGTDAGQGVLLEFSWASLPRDIRDALEDLAPGEVSRPVGFNGDTYLFQLESWRRNPSEMGEDLIRLAREELGRQRWREACDGLRRRLRGQTPVRIHEERLPFRYVPDAGA
jgi:hypothetical protein